MKIELRPNQYVLELTYVTMTMSILKTRHAQHAHPPDSSSWPRLRPGVTDELFLLSDASSGCESTLLGIRNEHVRARRRHETGKYALVLDGLGHQGECLLDVRRILRRCLNEGY